MCSIRWPGSMIVSLTIRFDCGSIHILTQMFEAGTVKVIGNKLATRAMRNKLATRARWIRREVGVVR